MGSTNERRGSHPGPRKRFTSELQTDSGDRWGDARGGEGDGGGRRRGGACGESHGSLNVLIYRKHLIEQKYVLNRVRVYS